MLWNCSNDQVIKASAILSDGFLKVESNETDTVVVTSMLHLDNKMYYSEPKSKTSSQVAFCYFDEKGNACNQFGNITALDNITLVSAATYTPECANYFAAFFVRDDTEYQAVVNSGMEPLAVSKQQNGVNQNPTAISYYRTSQNGDEYVVNIAGHGTCEKF
ncbi:hypothetical protein HDE_09130 [Halotydeus destructor]|nr:hypothetical protein HDE_09130 [Halotydeus destructor]